MSNTHARGSDPSTSHKAITEEEAQRLAEQAWGALKSDGRWLSYFQWSKISGIKYASLTPRGKSLWIAGRVERKKMAGYNDLGVLKSLLHYRAK